MTALVASIVATVWPYLIAGGAIILALLGYGAQRKSAGVAEQKAKEAEARAKNLDDIRRSNDAAAGVRVDELSDPNNRDNRG